MGIGNPEAVEGDTFKSSNDALFEQKLVDVGGLYVSPTARAVVFGYDEKTQCQAWTAHSPRGRWNWVARQRCPRRHGAMHRRSVRGDEPDHR